MRPYRFAAGALVMVLLFAAGCVSAPEVATYHRHGFSFDYPPAWNLTEERDPDGGVTLDLDGGGGNLLTISTTPNLSTRFPPTTRLDTLNVWLAESRAHLLSVNAVVIEERSEAIAGNAGYRIEYSVRRDGIAYRNTLVLTAIGDTGYSFSLFALPASRDAMAQGLQTVLDSFRI
jgi:hypothetical protein